MIRGIAWVTGASRGIGLATARRLAELGATVVLSARHATTLDVEVERLGHHGITAHAVPCDVSDPAEVATAHARIAADHGPVEILVANAAVLSPVGALHEAPLPLMIVNFETNVLGVMTTMRTVLPGMVARGAGAVVILSSGAAAGAVPGWAAYAASKAAVESLTRTVGAEVAEAGVRVNALRPGIVDTPMQAKVRSMEAEGAAAPIISQLQRAHALGQLRDPREVATAICWMASSLCSLSGQVLEMDERRLEVGMRRVQGWDA